MATPSKFKVALLQRGATKQPQENLQSASSQIGEAAEKGASLICLPELFLSEYFCQTEDNEWFDLAEPIPGPTSIAIGKLAKQTQTVIIAPIFEKRTEGLYHNSVVAMDKTGEMVGHYRKMHIPDDPGYYEKFYFTPGDLGFQVFETSIGKIGSLICWDQWFPEAARIASLKGAHLLVYPTAIGWHPEEKDKEGKLQYEAWKTIQRGHAIANGVYVAAINRIGHEKPEESGAGIEFWGQSFLCDPQGTVLSEGSIDGEEILISEVDLVHLENIRRNWPFLRDRRIDAYPPICERYLDTPSRQKSN